MNWIELKGLHELYTNGSVRKNITLSKSAEIKFLINSLHILHETSKNLCVDDGYNAIYEQKYLPLFNKYFIFLERKELLKPQIRFDIGDIEVLFTIDAGLESGNLQYLKEQIISSNESLRGVSLMFFRNEKYLIGKDALTAALKKVLGVTEFANEKDKQYIYKLECHQPKVIVLCENLDFLTKPEKPRKHGIELWYAGGKNIAKLDFADTRGLPVYYSCDWDYDGLLIYTWVKEKIPSVKLLFPSGQGKSIVKTEHQSLWSRSSQEEELSGLPKEIFTAKEKELIRQLMSRNEWIVEEGNDLISMLAFENFDFTY